MATADLKLIYGGGGGFAPSFFSGALRILAGATGTIITITAPVGKKVRLTALWSTSDNADVSVLVNGSAVINALTLTKEPNAIGAFAVGRVGLSDGNGSVIVGSSSTIDYIESINTITVVKNTGSTVGSVFYSYAYGD